MLSLLGSVDGQSNLPPNTAHLLKFNSEEKLLWDEAIGSSWINDCGVPPYVSTWSKFKDGAIFMNATTGVVLDSTNNIGTKDFTIEMWLYAYEGEFMEIFSGNKVVEGGWWTTGYPRLTRGSMYWAEPYRLDFNITSAYTIALGKLNPNTWTFVRCGRKGNTIFGSMNGGANVILAIPASTATAGGYARLGSCGVNVGNGYVGYIDEFLMQIGIGNDSIVVPTKAY